MGCILTEPDGSELHAEARSKSFSIFTDYGRESVEVDWNQLKNLEALVGQLRRYYDKHHHQGSSESAEDSSGS